METIDSAIYIRLKRKYILIYVYFYNYYLKNIFMMRFWFLYINSKNFVLISFQKPLGDNKICIKIVELFIKIFFDLYTVILHFFLNSAQTINSTIIRRMSDSDKDRPLIEALVIIENTLSPKKRHICNGRFLTMHKRRRKKLQTRSLAYDPAMLDDILHGQVQCILDQVGNWRFNAFSLETVTGGNKYI